MLEQRDDKQENLFKPLTRTWYTRYIPTISTLK